LKALDVTAYYQHHLTWHLCTARLAGNFAAQAQREGSTPEAVRAERIAKHPAKRLGQPKELGNTCAFLCSIHAFYINGQNILLDGGPFASV
jgi:3-oxoacyl-[acyl-carrier protein] reductase